MSDKVPPKGNIKDRSDRVYSRTQDQPDYDPKGTRRPTTSGSPRTTTAKGDAQDKMPVTGAAAKVKKATDAGYSRIESIKKGDEDHDF
jgi:hypothetical protein